jgi:hypothetical protein
MQTNLSSAGTGARWIAIADVTSFRDPELVRLFGLPQELPRES